MLLLYFGANKRFGYGTSLLWSRVDKKYANLIFVVLVYLTASELNLIFLLVPATSFLLTLFGLDSQFRRNAISKKWSLQRKYCFYILKFSWFWRHSKIHLLNIFMALSLFVVPLLAKSWDFSPFWLLINLQTRWPVTVVNHCAGFSPFWPM